MNINFKNKKRPELDHLIVDFISAYVDDFLTKHYKEECKNESTQNGLSVVCGVCLIKYMLSVIKEPDYYNLLVNDKTLIQRVVSDQLHCAANAYLLQKERLTEFL